MKSCLFTTSLRTCGLLIAMGLFGSPAAHADSVLWYGGDGPSNGFVNNTRLAQGVGVCLGATENTCGNSVVDDFIVFGGGWQVTGLFSNNFASGSITAAPVTEALWTIRTGAGPGMFGQILFQGMSPATIVPTGRSFGGMLEYTVAVSGLSLTLGAGDYFLNVSPLADKQIYYTGVSNGAGSIGAPGPAAFLREEYFLSDGAPDYHMFEDTINPTSMGVVGTATLPEPSTTVPLLAAFLTLLLPQTRGCRRLTRTLSSHN